MSPAQFPLLLPSYISMVHLLQGMNQCCTDTLLLIKSLVI